MNCGIDDEGNPVSQPIKDLKTLIEWLPPGFQVCASGKSRHPDNVCQTLRHSRQAPNEPKVLVCHDMAGGYLDDRFIQGCKGKEDAYLFYHWQLIDTFIYFSHQFVTIPPAGWILAAHRHGVDILGTIITEWDDGAALCKQMLVSTDQVHEVTTKLANIAAFYGFDGWLINIENKIEPEQIPLLQSFARQLTQKCHTQLQYGTVLWYDSVIDSGELKWQDELNSSNEMFFNVCDGIFLNYCITKEKLAQSREKALSSGRQRDVYVGLDVFGRGTPGGGGFNLRNVLEMILSEGLSSAFFAPGWVMEHLGPQHFQENNIKFWGLLADLLTTRPLSLPFSTSFCQGRGEKYFLHGEMISDVPWFNLGLQQTQPSFTQSQFISYQIIQKQVPAIANLTENEGHTEGSIEFVRSVSADINCQNNSVTSTGDLTSVQTSSSITCENETPVAADSSGPVGDASKAEKTDCSPGTKTELKIQVISEKRQATTDPRMSLDPSCGYNGGGCLRLDALSKPDQPVIFKLMNISGIKKLRQLCVTWKAQLCNYHFALMLSPASGEASLQNAEVIFETNITALAADLLCQKSSKMVSRIAPEQPHEVSDQRNWFMSKHNVTPDDMKKSGTGITEDMTLSAVLLPCSPMNSNVSSTVIDPLICLWIGQIQAATDPTSFEKAETPILGDLCLLEVKAGQKLSSSNLEQIVFNPCFKERQSLHPGLSSNHPQQPKSSVRETLEAMIVPALPSTIPAMSLPQEMSPALFTKLDLNSQETEGTVHYLLKWNTVTKGNVDHYLIYLGVEERSKTFLGFALSNCFIYSTKNEIENMSFFIQPVVQA